MMLTGSSTSPFAAMEAAIYRTLFAGSSPYAALTREETEGCADRGAGAAARGSSKNGAAGAPSPKGQTLKAKEEPENREKTD